jgi:hypothetical protein
MNDEWHERKIHHSSFIIHHSSLKEIPFPLAVVEGLLPLILQIDCSESSGADRERFPLFFLQTPKKQANNE